MTDMTDSPLTVTLKAGLHYDAPWVVLRADTPDQMTALLGALGQQGVFANASAAAVELAGVYAATTGLGAKPIAVETAPTAVAPIPTTPAPSVPAYQAAAAPGPVCQHGPMVYRESKPGSEKVWRAYFCPTPQGTPGQCPPNWLK